MSAFFAGLHYWWPKITGRMYPEGIAQFAAVLLFFGFNFTFAPQFVMGYLGMPRRYHDYLPQFQVYHVMSSAGAMILAVAYLMPLFYFAWALRFGRHAGDNPWDATGLEWRASSPPAKENFARIPVVTEDPYQYHEHGQGPVHGAPAYKRQGG